VKYFLLLAFIFIQGGNKIIIKDAWMRPAPETFNSALYCTVINNGDKADTLYKAESEVSDDVQIHETYKKGDMTGMRPVENLVIAPHDSVVFKPGGYHIMLMKLKENAVVNNKKPVSLFFKVAGQIKIQAEVGLR
jgi:periplasmic copper chaperone A